jgi:RNA polymerase sigma-70 factor (ECF subfamily)
MSPEWPLERYRPLLLLQARQLGLDRRLQARFDPADLVQETLLRAHRQRDQFRGGSEGEFIKWLQVILAHTADDMVDKERAGKRDVAREQPMPALVAESSARIEAFLADRGPSPSEIVARQEQLLRLAEAIEQLPADQRNVLILHDLQGAKVAEAADRLQRSEAAVASLLFRARRKLAELLNVP